jgi:hypothetical protein
MPFFFPLFVMCVRPPHLASTTDFIVLIILGLPKEYNTSEPPRYAIYSPVTSYLLGPNN